jgi:hypothetical protein
MSYDDLIQAGPRPDSEVVASRITVTLVLRELVRPVVAAPKPEMHKLATANPKRDRDVYLCKLSRQAGVTEKPRALAQASSSARTLSPPPLRCFRRCRNRTTSFRSDVLLPL